MLLYHVPPLPRGTPLYHRTGHTELLCGRRPVISHFISLHSSETDNNAICQRSNYMICLCLSSQPLVYPWTFPSLIYFLINLNKWWNISDVMNNNYEKFNLMGNAIVNDGHHCILAKRCFTKSNLLLKSRAAYSWLLSLQRKIPVINYTVIVILHHSFILIRYFFLKLL